MSKTKETPADLATRVLALSSAEMMQQAADLIPKLAQAVQDLEAKNTKLKRDVHYLQSVG